MIEVDSLVKRFALPGGRSVVAVAGVSFRVAAGEVYGLLGPNGAGKTTTLRMLLGLLEPSAGRATVGGFSAAAAPEEVRRRVGVVSAHSGVYPSLTVREMLLYFADLYGVPPADAKAEVARLGPLLGFAELLRRPCATLSTGQRQRVNLARALVHRPPVLLLDEPTTGVDVVGSQMVAEFVAHLRDAGKAVILCTHRLDEAERLCTRIGLMHEGRIVREGTLAELRAVTGRESLVEMFLQLAGMGPALGGEAAA